MKVCVIGTGYVGLVTGACLAETGHFVTCVDSNAVKVRKLKQGVIPFYEPGLSDMVRRNTRERRLLFAKSLADVTAGAEVYFIAVGTPAADNGSSDIRQVLAAAAELGRVMTKPVTIVAKSTSPVGTAESIRKAIQRELKRRGKAFEFDLVSNPEFLKEGDAINDFMRPDRVIVGVDHPRAAKQMRQLYAPIIRSHEQLLVMGVRDAEMTKYAANAMLASRISLMNEIANLSEKVGVDVENVRLGIGSDRRIGYSFIYPGCGYGGSCFPKDVKSLVYQAKRQKLKSRTLQAVDETNEAQKLRLFEKLRAEFGPKLKGRVFGLWGISFKPGTDDIREAPSLTLIEKLVAAGARVCAYDPMAMENAKRSLPKQWYSSKSLTLAKDQYAAAKGADALILVTEWESFRSPDFERLKKSMRGKLIVDGRNQYQPDAVRSAGFRYMGIGR
jgi:UDPglucose 6-dehydrogenase